LVARPAEGDGRLRRRGQGRHSGAHAVRPGGRRAGRRGAGEGVVDGVEIVHAPGQGDDTVVAIAAAAASEPVTTVTADRALGERCRAAGSDVVPPSWLLERLTT
jgi:hypothetical protein